MGGLVNNTKRQVARKRRYFSGCTRAAQSNKNERRPRLKKDEKRRQRKFITSYIYIHIYFQCYVNVVVYRNNGERNEGLRAIPFPPPGSSIYGFPRLDSRPRGIIILIGTTQISIVRPRLSNVDTAWPSMFALNIFETAVYDS